MEPITTAATLQSWLEKLKSGDAEARSIATRAGGPMGAAAVAPLADLMAGPDKGAARAAQQALERVSHHAARPGTRQDEAARVAQELLKVAQSPRPRMVRSEALHLLGFIANDAAVPALARLLQDPEVREDARMAIERIPGVQSQRALQMALQQAPGDFAPALRQSLYNRGLSKATVGAQPMR